MWSELRRTIIWCGNQISWELIKLTWLIHIEINNASKQTLNKQSDKPCATMLLPHNLYTAGLVLALGAARTPYSRDEIHFLQNHSNPATHSLAD